MLLKKISSEWEPSENRHLKIGETLEVTDYKGLVEARFAVIVNEQGEEQPLPGTVFVCPICFTKTEKVEEFTDHVLNAHKKVEVKTETKVNEPVKKVEKKGKQWTEEEKKAFGEKMRLAREKRKAAKGA